MSIAATMTDTRTAGSKMRSIVFASSVGTIIEWYDFLIYATAAALVFNKAFFPTIDPLAGTLAALGTYAVGFLARPLGGALFGHFGDRLGRKSMLVLTMFIMGLSTFCIGLLPNYASIGVLAPILLILLRIVQGIGLGGEWGGASLMVIEHSPPANAASMAASFRSDFRSDWCSQRWSLRLRPNFPKPISSPGAGAFRSLPASYCWGSAHSFDREFPKHRCSRE